MGKIPSSSSAETSKKQKRILIASVVAVIIIIGGIGGYVWYSWDPWDSDGDGIGDADDAFPDDHSASIDTDGDGWPDEWNKGKSAADSTSNPKLRLDAFINNSDEWVDEDNDGYGDNKDDKFPGNSDEWADTDGDGHGDNEADKFPNDKYEWADSDGDGFGDNSDIAPDDNTIPNISDLNFEWVDILSGTFWMGSFYEEIGDNEHPRHKVSISKEFQMLKFEVKQAQWEEVMGSNPSSFSGDNNPVERVSWNDSQSFISRLNKLDHDYAYRLPTEAEWEYASRAGSNTTYSYGNDSAQLKEYAWYVYDSNDRTHPVGQKQPNAWGLYDMHGNVWEWCQDWFDRDYYENSPNTDPQGPASGYSRILRGGSWSHDADICRSANRHHQPPIFGHNNYGFRLVREEI